MKKNILLIVLTFFLLIVGTYKVEAVQFNESNIYLNNNGVIISFQEYERLRKLGFTDLQIETMEQDEFDKNKDLEGTVVAKGEKYYKTVIVYSNGINNSISAYSNSVFPFAYTEEITEDLYNNINEDVDTQGLTNGYTETGYKKMTTTIISVNGRYRYKNDLEWKKLPKVRSYDIISISIDSGVSGISDTKAYRTTSYVEDSTTTTCFYKNYGNGVWSLFAGGYAVRFNLPKDGGGLTIKTINTYMYFEVQKLTTNTITTLNAYGDYKHAITDVNANISFSVGLPPSVGISIGPEFVDKYDSISTAQATWSGLLW